MFLISSVFASQVREDLRAMGDPQVLSWSMVSFSWSE